MIQPNEAPGLTATLARAIAQRVADLATLIADDWYRAELARRGQLAAARAAATHLVDAALSLEGIANALAEAAEPAASTLGDRVADRIAAALRAAPASGDQP